MSLRKWKKIQLLDLADKLDLYVAQSSTKAKIADAIDAHLKELDQPLDLAEYPELATYYQESAANSDDEVGSDPSEDADGLKDRLKTKVQDAAEAVAEVVSNAVTTITTPTETKSEDTEDEDQDDLVLPHGTPLQNWFSQLDFQRITPSQGSFAFKFNEFMHDVQNKTMEANGSVQDVLSTIPAVDALFFAVEAYVYVVRNHLELTADKPFVTVTSTWQEIAALTSFWSVWSLILPAFISYYINFIRYDLPDVLLDPMVFHVAKALLALLLTQWQPSFADEATYAVKDVAGSVSMLEVTAHWFRFALTEWKLQLGLLPFILAFAGSALCLYVL
ncbi:LAME_0E11936g1_1 [Lachancea meyersii CBS 8951]|uniref:LAME_0E11936g1_1 n=1 Tax=Lachancea meyersii CBS 8951 TaxID=1266667 RepID=A0A1G4JL28_9SACH|nr:LAME_0E11936g1_1 [Lachancea meyersii CBS 8951]